MNQIFAWLAKYLRRPGPAAPTVETPPPVEAQKPTGASIDLNPLTVEPKPTGVFDYKGGIQTLLTQNEDARTRMKEPPPKQEDDELGDTLGGLASLFMVNPQSASTAAGYGARSSQQQFQAKLAEHKTRVEQAAQEEESTRALIGDFLQRDAAAERVSGQLDKARIDAASKTALAQLKSDRDFRLRIASMLGDGTGTAEGFGLLFMGMGYDPEVSNSMGSQLEEDIRSNPSFKLSLEMLGTQQKQQQLDQQRRVDAAKQFRDAGSDFGMRLSAAMQLRELGDPYFSSLSPEQIEQAASQENYLQSRAKYEADYAKAHSEKEKIDAANWQDVTDARIKAMGQSVSLEMMRYMMSLQYLQMATSSDERKRWKEQNDADLENAKIVAHDKLAVIDDEIKTTRKALNALDIFDEKPNEADDAEVAELKRRLTNLKLAKQKIIAEYHAKLGASQPLPPGQVPPGLPKMAGSSSGTTSGHHLAPSNKNKTKKDDPLGVLGNGSDR